MGYGAHAPSSPHASANDYYFGKVYFGRFFFFDDFFFFLMHPAIPQGTIVPRGGASPCCMAPPLVKFAFRFLNMMHHAIPQGNVSARGKIM